MRELIPFLLLAACATSGKPAPSQTTAAARFHYDAASGACVDAAGEHGYNAPDPKTLFARKDDDGRGGVYPDVNAECVDFSGFNFNDHIGMGYAMLKNWNFKGAKFTGAKLHFASMEMCDFSGADVSEISWGYAQIVGTGDAHTKKMQECHDVPDHALECLR